MTVGFSVRIPRDKRFGLPPFWTWFQHTNNVPVSKIRVWYDTGVQGYIYRLHGFCGYDTLLSKTRKKQKKTMRKHAEKDKHSIAGRTFCANFRRHIDYAPTDFCFCHLLFFARLPVCPLPGPREHHMYSSVRRVWYCDVAFFFPRALFITPWWKTLKKITTKYVNE